MIRLLLYCIVNSGCAEEQRVRRERERERCLLICISLSVAPVAGALPLSFITTVQYSTRTRSNLSNPKRRAAVHATYCLLAVLFARCNSSSVVSAHRACRHQLTPLALRYITLLHFSQTRDRLHSYQVFIQLYPT